MFDEQSAVWLLSVSRLQYHRFVFGAIFMKEFLEERLRLVKLLAEKLTLLQKGACWNWPTATRAGLE
jgi:hypothetical protein